jgi:hypothetical protein
MKQIIPLSVAIVALAFITGCASNKVWYSPNKSAAECQRDLKECRYEAEKYSTGAGAGYETGIGSGLAIGLKQRDLIMQCMDLKGYRLVSTNELPAGSKTFRLK